MVVGLLLELVPPMRGDKFEDIRRAGHKHCLRLRLRYLLHARLPHLLPRRVLDNPRVPLLLAQLADVLGHEKYLLRLLLKKKLTGASKSAVCTHLRRSVLAGLSISAPTADLGRRLIFVLFDGVSVLGRLTRTLRSVPVQKLGVTITYRLLLVEHLDIRPEVEGIVEESLLQKRISK